ncbi:MAG: heavy metal translocating P-type ATPase [Candidatus Aminicenantia bacterium]
MKEEIINIEGMHCASCVALIEDALKKKEGVINVKVNLSTEKAYVKFDDKRVKRDELEKVIEESGYKVLKESPSEELERRKREISSWRKKFLLSALFSIPLFYLSMGSHLGFPTTEFIVENNSILQLAFTTPIILVGSIFFRRGLLSLYKTRKANMDTLVSVGVLSAYLYSLVLSFPKWIGKSTNQNLYYEIAGFLITFITLGRWLEAMAKGKTSEAIRKLIELKPKRVMVSRNGKEIEISADELNVDDIFIVHPGERIPADGEVVEGYSSIDESMITGESIPKGKSKGDFVVGGTLNKNGFLKVRAKKVGKETVLSQIIKIVEETQGTKAPIEELADRLSSIFVPVVFSIAIVSLFFWLLSGKGFPFSLKIFVSVLMIACPCALGLATPTAVIVGTGIGARKGILIKNVRAIQLLGKIDTVVFDKTGTITKGEPKVEEIIPLNNSNKEEILLLASIAEKRSEHPLSEAILREAERRGIEIPDPKDFSVIPGNGLKASFNKINIILGNLNFMKENRLLQDDIEREVLNFESEGKTTVVVAKNSKIIGLIKIIDEIKENAEYVIKSLKRMGKEVLMITGDRKSTGEAIGKKLGIDKVLSEVLPQDKSKEIKRLQEMGKKVLVVGDGINDAPALSQADVGVAMGSGTDIAIEAGDVVLMKDDLRDVLIAIEIGKYTMKKIKENLFWAFIYNMLGIPIAAGILYPFTGFILNPLIAGGAMSLSSISVVTNSLSMRLKKFH